MVVARPSLPCIAAAAAAAHAIPGSLSDPTTKNRLSARDAFLSSTFSLWWPAPRICESLPPPPLSNALRSSSSFFPFDFLLNGSFAILRLSYPAKGDHRPRPVIEALAVLPSILSFSTAHAGHRLPHLSGPASPISPRFPLVRCLLSRLPSLLVKARYTWLRCAARLAVLAFREPSVVYTARRPRLIYTNDPFGHGFSILPSLFPLQSSSRRGSSWPPVDSPQLACSWHDSAVGRAVLSRLPLFINSSHLWSGPFDPRRPARQHSQQSPPGAPLPLVRHRGGSALFFLSFFVRWLRCVRSGPEKHKLGSWFLGSPPRSLGDPVPPAPRLLILDIS